MCNSLMRSIENFFVSLVKLIAHQEEQFYAISFCDCNKIRSQNTRDSSDYTATNRICQRRTSLRIYSLAWLQVNDRLSKTASYCSAVIWTWWLTSKSSRSFMETIEIINYTPGRIDFKQNHFVTQVILLDKNIQFLWSVSKQIVCLFLFRDILSKGKVCQRD